MIFSTADLVQSNNKIADSNAEAINGCIGKRSLIHILFLKAVLKVIQEKPSPKGEGVASYLDVVIEVKM